MKLIAKKTELRIGATVLFIYAIVQLLYGETFTFPTLTKEANPGGFWFSVAIYFLLSLFLFVFSFMDHKKQTKLSKLINDTDLKDIASKKYNKSLKRDHQPDEPPTT